jgi:hypothetical protein
MFRFAKADSWVEHVSANPGKNAVILIPGTWGHGFWNVIVKGRSRGKNTPPLPNTGHWFDVEGKIASTIGLNAFDVYVLRWSGRNSVSDRRKAAAVLLSHLDNWTRMHPSGQHGVIAHSHGGNIASMAFAQMEESDDLGRVHFAAMSTPFIWFQVRELSNAMKQSVYLLIFIAFLI